MFGKTKIAAACMFASLGASFGASLCASFAASAQTTTLRIHSFSAPQALDQTKHLNPWAEKVTKESGGKLKVEVYEVMRIVRGGV